MTKNVFQITQEMIDASSTLTKEDLGLWCYMLNGRYHGFTSTKAEAYLKVRSLVH